MNKKLLFFVFFISFVFISVYGQANRVDVRIASSLPRNSDWGKTMDRMADAWARVTNNEVRLIIHHDGREGSESKMLSSISNNSIQGGLFTSFGILDICPGVLTVSIPFLVKDDREMDIVVRELQPILDTKMDSKYHVIAWSKSGWVNIFSNSPVRTPDDMRKLKMHTNPDAGEMNRAFRSMGFDLLEMEIGDISPRLANGSIQAIYQMPAASAAFGFHRYLKNMLDLPLAPILGSIVVNRETWNKIPPQHQREITRVTGQIVREFDTSLPRLQNNAIRVMERDGLQVVKITPAQEDLWRDEIIKAMPTLFGRTFDKELYDKIVEVLEKNRSGN